MVFLLFLVFIKIICESELEGKTVLLSFDVGENVVTNNVDDELIRINGKLFFGGDEFTNFFLSTNGFVLVRTDEEQESRLIHETFRCSVANITSEYYNDIRLIAPMCDDLMCKVSSTGERIFYRESSSVFSFLLDYEYDTISDYINENYVKKYNTLADFQTSWYFVATFEKVSYVYGSEKISFQIIIATDETNELSFAIFQYPSDMDISASPNLIGIYESSENGDERNMIIINDQVGEYFPYPRNIFKGSNVNIEGIYIFRLDMEEFSFEEKKTCQNKYDIASCNYPNGKCVYKITNETEGTKSYACECSDSYFGEECKNQSICYGIPGNDESVCTYGNGVCTSTDKCECKNGTFGDMCQNFTCFGISNYDESVCSGSGYCRSLDECICNRDDVGGRECNETACYGRLKKYSSVVEKIVIDNFNYENIESFDYTQWDSISNGSIYLSSEILNSDKCTNLKSFGKNAIVFGNNSDSMIKTKLLQRGEVNLEFFLSMCTTSVVYSNIPPILIYVVYPDGEEELIDFVEDGTQTFPSKVQVIFETKKQFQLVIQFNQEFLTVHSMYVNECSAILGSFILFIFESEEIPCYGNGMCISNDTCECQDGYGGDECDIIDCSKVNDCSNNGLCVSSNFCVCTNSNYGGENCSVNACNGVPIGSNMICSGEGSCKVVYQGNDEDEDNYCCCKSGHYGDDCSDIEKSSEVLSTDEMRCLSTGDVNSWEVINGGEFVYDENNGCGKISTQSIYFNGQINRKLISKWKVPGSYELKFWFVLGNNISENCLPSEEGEEVIVHLEEEDGEDIFEKELKILSFQNWTYVNINYSSNATHRISIYQNYFSPNDDQWGIDSLEWNKVSDYTSFQWWYVIIFVFGLLGINLVLGIISLIIIYVIYNRKQALKRKQEKDVILEI